MVRPLSFDFQFLHHFRNLFLVKSSSAGQFIYIKNRDAPGCLKIKKVVFKQMRLNIDKFDHSANIFGMLVLTLANQLIMALYIT